MIAGSAPVFAAAIGGRLDAWAVLLDLPVQSSVASASSIPRLMRDFSITIETSAPAERVWQVMSDTDRWHEWTPSISSVKRLGGAPFAVGTRVISRQPKLPPAVWTITAIEPGRSFTWVSTAPGLRVVASHRVEPTDTGSRATLSVEMFGVLGGLWGRLTKDITERYIAMEAQGLVRRSEDPSYRHGVS